jgi:hypothetical protein
MLCILIDIDQSVLKRTTFLSSSFLLQDALLDKHLATGTFDEDIRPIGRPMKSLLVKLPIQFADRLLLYSIFIYLFLEKNIDVAANVWLGFL